MASIGLQLKNNYQPDHSSATTQRLLMSLLMSVSLILGLLLVAPLSSFAESDSSAAVSSQNSADISTLETTHEKTNEKADTETADHSAITKSESAHDDPHATEGGSHGEHEKNDAHDAPKEMANLMTLIFGHKENPTITDIQYWENVIFAFFAGILLVLGARALYRKRKMIPSRGQMVAELIVEYLYDLFHGILGKHTKRFLPFLGTLFVYILTMNVMGIIPGLKSATTSINITASMALLVFFYSQYIGFKELGPKGWLMHLMGDPKDAIGWAIVPLMLPIHLIGELAKPFSLAMRLFGNITGEDILIFSFVGLGMMIMSGIGLSSEWFGVGIPLNVPFVLMALMFSTIQAIVFTVLSTIYLSLMLPHEEAH
ncbi:MAG: F0F1 ATP synthase subunit A [candidate division Zixibacteria bacterium]|nr:F0F1 ATP synthase subunit A [candidate division Zixibacteria bacterium]